MLSLLLAAALSTTQPSAAPVTPPPAPTASSAPAPTLSDVTALRAEVYLLRLRDLQRQAADLEKYRAEVEAAVRKDTNGAALIDWTTGRLVPVDAKKGETP